MQLEYRRNRVCENVAQRREVRENAAEGRRKSFPAVAKERFNRYNGGTRAKGRK